MNAIKFDVFFSTVKLIKYQKEHGKLDLDLNELKSGTRFKIVR